MFGRRLADQAGPRQTRCHVPNAAEHLPHLLARIIHDELLVEETSGVQARSIGGLDFPAGAGCDPGAGTVRRASALSVLRWRDRTGGTHNTAAAARDRCDIATPRAAMTLLIALMMPT